ncbi:MAG: hypothetical protein HN617_16665 [Planctomycetaceae bacterium]|jgi:hypothetical protein|nr:hypothetical protein [Planctomycetaceae bacterium]MBT4726173.1 hypothetical protein [Planctomycetaceae bacterium]MBT5598533.1 hypothetical protein [Planctomycetaceae bacterium]MBT5884184.1 hypothetical protein [Planctomycetaceae bacterium]MBT6845872.1 hypothetical protein [Planctomycetaceae bacterium]
MEQKLKNPNSRRQRGSFPRAWMILLLVLLITLLASIITIVVSVMPTQRPHKISYDDFRIYLSSPDTITPNTIIDRGDIKLVEISTSNFVSVHFVRPQTITDLSGNEQTSVSNVQVDFSANDSTRRQLEQLLEGNIGGDIKLRSVNYVYLPPDDTASLAVLVSSITGWGCCCLISIIAIVVLIVVLVRRNTKDKTFTIDESMTRTMPCLDCGGIVSRRADKCPHCGAPVRPIDPPVEGPQGIERPHED